MWFILFQCYASMVYCSKSESRYWNSASFLHTLFIHDLITLRNSHHRKWPLFVLNVACSKDSSRELAEVLSWNTTRLASYRMLPSCYTLSILIFFSVLEKDDMPRNIISFAASREILLGHSWKIHQPISGQGSWRYQYFDNMAWIMTVFLPQFAGVSNSSTLYKRGIRVCTGTGLGASLSTCLQESFYHRTVSDRAYLSINRSQNPDWWLMASVYLNNSCTE